MKEKTYLLNTILAVVVGVALLAVVLARTFIPAIILPGLNLPNIVLLSLISLLIEHYLFGSGRRCYICIPALSALTFGILPWAAGVISAIDALKIGVLGGAAFTATTWLFTSMLERISSGPASKVAPAVGALCMYCAAQCLTGILI